MTSTLEDLMAQCIKDNPEMHCTINGEIIKLTKEEYDKAIRDWAAMRLIQIEFEQNPTEPKPSVFKP
jgi:hypothetical protein